MVSSFLPPSPSSSLSASSLFEFQQPVKFSFDAAQLEYRPQKAVARIKWDNASLAAREVFHLHVSSRASLVQVVYPADRPRLLCLQDPRQCSHRGHLFPGSSRPMWARWKCKSQAIRAQGGLLYFLLTWLRRFLRTAPQPEALTPSSLLPFHPYHQRCRLPLWWRVSQPISQAFVFYF